MPSLITHAIVGAGATRLSLGSGAPRSLYGAAVVLSCLPDADVVGFRLGVPYAAPWGHRGASHALAMAALVSLPVAAALARLPRGAAGALRWPALWAVLFVAMASHGLLDALTNGGHGIALLWPFSDARFFAPWQPIAVSPISVTRFLSARGLHVLASEVMVVWAPLAVAIALAERVRARRGGRSLDLAIEGVADEHDHEAE